MANVKLDLSNKSIAAKIQMGTEVGAAMGDPAPAPYTAKAAALKAATADLQGKSLAAKTAEHAAITATNQQDLSEEAFDKAYGVLGGQVEIETGGDPDQITALAYAIRSDAQPVTSLDFVSDFSVTTTNLPQTLDFAWDRAKGELTFEIRGSKPTDPAGTYSYSATTTRTRLRANGFESGVPYTFSIRAHGSGEMVSPWSDPFTKMAS